VNGGDGWTGRGARNASFSFHDASASDWRLAINFQGFREPVGSAMTLQSKQA
jgi:hypothetical protein